MVKVFTNILEFTSHLILDSSHKKNIYDKKKKLLILKKEHG